MASSPLPARGARRPGRRRRRGQLFGALLLMVGVLLLLTVGLNPWVLHIGGRFTPTMSWDGVGQVRASNGGRYALSVHLIGGVLGTSSEGGMACDQFSGCESLRGSAELCSRNGPIDSFTLRGAVHAWWSTQGARTSLELTRGSPRRLPAGWVVAFSGHWYGESLQLEDSDNSFTEVFTPRGDIRTSTSTADAGTATVTLTPGSRADFERACRALPG